MAIMECTDASDIRMVLHRLSAGVWINISRILFVFLIKGEGMIRQGFLYKTAGAINKDNVNQVYTLLCDLIWTEHLICWTTIWI